MCGLSNPSKNAHENVKGGDGHRAASALMHPYGQHSAFFRRVEGKESIRRLDPAEVGHIFYGVQREKLCVPHPVHKRCLPSIQLEASPQWTHSKTISITSGSVFNGPLRNGESFATASFLKSAASNPGRFTE